MPRCKKLARNEAQFFLDKMVHDIEFVYPRCAQPLQYLLTNKASYVVANIPLF